MSLINIGRFLFCIGLVVFMCSLYVSYISYPNYKKGQQTMTQRIIILCVHFLGNLVLLMESGFIKEHVIFYIFQVGILLISWAMIRIIIPKSHLGMWHLVQMLGVVGLLMISRLDYEKGVKQGMIFGVALLVGIIIALAMKYIQFLPALTYLYYVVALVLLVLPNTAQFGANNWFTVAGVTFQPSEIAKLLFLMFLGAFFSKPISHIRLIIASGMTLVLLLVLVYQKDLGGALIFYLAYITLAYLASNKLKYFITGLAGGALGGVAGYYLFSHVRTRVTAWLDPFAFIDDQGYQVTQSLFAISAGGWFGTGFTAGMPNRIPVHISDFIYAAIAEEFGNIFAMALLALFVILFLMIAKTAFPIENLFDTILVFGIGIILMIQTFLIVGGVIKMIPSTGVTLPLVSYGGTSLVVVMIMIGVVQGIQLKHLPDDKEDA